MLKRGSAECSCPRLNAQRFEGLIVENIRDNILTESNIRGLVNLLDEEMDGVAKEQRDRLQAIEGELEEVKLRLLRVWQMVESTGLDMADAAERIKAHRDRQAALESAADEARSMLADRRALLDSEEVIAAYAADMSELLRTSDLTQTKAFVRSFVKAVEVRPAKATIVYAIPTPDDGPLRGADNRGDHPRRRRSHIGRRWVGWT